MIKFSGTNVLVHSISQVITIPSKSGGQDFQKRELIVDNSWDKDGHHYSDFVLIEFTGDRMALLDSIYPGQRINVEGMLSGREYNNRIFNTIKGLNITLNQPQQQYPSAPAPAPMPGYPQAQYQQSAPGYPQQAATPQQSYNSPTVGPGANDLPWK